MTRRTLLGVWFCLLAGVMYPAWAHEVHHTVEATSAIAVKLTYADGKPFAFEAYEAYPDGAEVPTQVGRTDGQGRALFVPGGIARWRIKAFSADGHGVDQRIDVPVSAPGASASVGTEQGPNRASLLLFGLSLLLGAFGTYQLWGRRKS